MEPTTTPTRLIRGGNGGRGKRQRDTTPTPPAAQSQAETIQPANPQINAKCRIIGCKNKVLLFENVPRKNRRLTKDELETDIQIASWLKRPVRYFFDDKPFYPWLPPEPYVNFDLRFKE